MWGECLSEGFTIEKCDEIWKEQEVKYKVCRPYEILERVGDLTYPLALSPALSHLLNVFHVS